MQPTNSQSRQLWGSIKGFPIGSLIKTKDGHIMTVTNIEAYQHVDKLVCKITVWSPQRGYVRLNHHQAEKEWIALEEK